MYDYFNRGLWQKCYSLLDPKLREATRVSSPIYAQRLEEFKQVYGAIAPWHIRINLHVGTTPKQKDCRRFAYVYVVWQDAGHEFHMFRERWIKEGGKWFSRVAGLVPNRQQISEPT